MDTFELTRATQAMAAIVRGIGDDQLDAPTPCPAYRVADLADHVGGLVPAFTHAALKTEPDGGPGGPGGDGRRLESDWRDRVVGDLDTLAVAWRAPAAWAGTTMAGPVEMPAPEAALVVLDELVVHAWDLAVATEQPYRPDRADVARCLAFVEGFEAPADADGGLFGPSVPVPEDAGPLERLLGRTGRDPGWRPA